MNFKSPCFASPPPHAETAPQAFGIPLSHVISNDRKHKLRHDHPREEHSNPNELMLSLPHLSSSLKRVIKEHSSSNSSLSSTSETPSESPLQSTPDTAPRTCRRVGFSVSDTNGEQLSDYTHTGFKKIYLFVQIIGQSQKNAFLQIGAFKG